MEWLLDDELTGWVLLDQVDGVVECLLLVGVDDPFGEVEEALHWVVRSTVTVTVTGPAQVEEATLLPVQPVAPVVVAVFQEAPTESWSWPLPRFSTSCSAARGAAATKPKREERSTVDRMAM